MNIKIEELTENEINILNKYITEVMTNNSKCKSCDFYLYCPWASECIADDFSSWVDKNKWKNK